MRRRLFAFALALMTTSAYADSVATMGAISGDVKINQGEAFTQAQPGQAVGAGDRILVMEGGKTSITFSDGCEMDISGGSLVTVPATSTCKGGVAKTQQIAPDNGGAVGNDAISSNPPVTHGIAGTSTDWDWIGTGVIVACLMFCGGEDNNNTVSP